MKINVEIDISPEEVRKLYGWPDLTAMQGNLMEQITEKVKKGDLEVVNKLLKPYVADGMRAVEAYQNMLMSFVKLSQGAGRSDTDKMDS